MITSRVVVCFVVLQVALCINYDAIVSEGVNLQDLCEECDTSTGSGYSYHPKYCHLFVHCTLGAEGQLSGQVKECTRGLLWSHAKKQCVWPAESDCPNNPCNNKSVTFRDVRNCNGYFSCSSGNQLLSYNCCGRDQRYSEQEMTCVLDPACNDPCLPGSANVTAKAPDCDRFPVESDPDKYLWTVGDNNVTMTCATGTAFSPDFCSCTKSSEAATDDVCEPYIWFPFDLDLKDKKGRTASGGNADVTFVPSPVGGGAASFKGNQRVVAWAMNNMEFRSNFTLSFRFLAKLPDPQFAQSERYALVDNSDCDKEATFGVALLRTTLRRGTVHGGFRLKNGLAFTASSGELLLNAWHEVVLMKHGPRAKLLIDGKPYLIEDNGTEADIDRVDCAMTIGTGTGLQDFVGLIDEVKYYKCVPKHYL